MQFFQAFLLILSIALVAAAPPLTASSLVARGNDSSSWLQPETKVELSSHLGVERRKSEKKKGEKAIDKLNAKSAELQSVLMDLLNQKILWFPRDQIEWSWKPGEQWEMDFNYCVNSRRWAYKLQYAKDRQLDYMKAELIYCATIMMTSHAVAGDPVWYRSTCYWWLDILEQYRNLFVERFNDPAPELCTVTDCPRLLEARNMTDFFRWAVDKANDTPWMGHLYPAAPNLRAT